MTQNKPREQFASRLGFILMTAGCAIGLGNVWRFSYITGQYGGGFFVLLYLIFLVMLGFPVMLMELAIGRAGRSTFPGAFRKLQNPASRFAWYRPAYLLFSGNLILLMFYSVITGWLLLYACGFITGKFAGATTVECSEIFSDMQADPTQQIIGMLISVLLTVLACWGGVRKTVEKSIKVMMIGLFMLLILLVVQSLSLPNAKSGLSFFLKPDLNNFINEGWISAVHAAMAQAFFTLSLGIGSIAVCGSYTSSDASLPREGLWIISLDTMVAIASGLIIFPACAAFGIKADAGPPLVFITLPNVFNNMTGGSFWGFLFFSFLSIAALSTLIAVFENLVAFGMDEWNWSRRKSCSIFGTALAVLSLPCIWGFNWWQGFQPLGANSNILDLEDFIVSNNLLPLGALFMTVFCFSRYGWRAENLFRELDHKKSIVLPRVLVFYLRWIISLIILLLWLVGWQQKFWPDLLK
ncbi:MAG: sodium-dependent transporter [Lentisphaerae bacterium]|nr:sodium-dependent transporter [Lentisphaerota bacterium]